MTQEETQTTNENHDKIKLMLNNLLNILQSIKTTINNIDQLNFNETANTLTSLAKGPNNITSRKNLELLRQNNQEHNDNIDKLMGRIATIRENGEISQESIKIICNEYKQLKARLTNDEKYSEELIKEIGEGRLELDKIIENIKKLKSKVQKDKAPKGKYDKAIDDSITKLEQDKQLFLARIYYIYYDKLAQTINSQTDKNILSLINDNFAAIDRMSWQQISNQINAQNAQNDQEKIKTIIGQEINNALAYYIRSNNNSDENNNS